MLNISILKYKWGGGKSPHYKYVTASDFDKEGGRI